MCTAGRDSGGNQFEIEALCNHLRAYISILEALRGFGFHFKSIRLTLTDFSGTNSKLLLASGICWSENPQA